jgi:hypothetical protein
VIARRDTFAQGGVHPITWAPSVAAHALSLFLPFLQPEVSSAWSLGGR